MRGVLIVDRVPRHDLVQLSLQDLRLRREDTAQRSALRTIATAAGRSSRLCAQGYGANPSTATRVPPAFAYAISPGRPVVSILAPRTAATVSCWPTSP